LKRRFKVLRNKSILFLTFSLPGNSLPGGFETEYVSTGTPTPWKGTVHLIPDEKARSEDYYPINC
jgi:hypothetical protein